MSFFLFSITIPANTTRAEPLETEIDLTPGIIHRVLITIPPGHAGLAHLQVFQGAHQVYPTSIGEDFSGDGSKYDFRDWYELEDAPYSMRLVGWNEDDTFEHEFIVGIGILPKWVLLPQLFAKKATGLIDRLLGREMEA